MADSSKTIPISTFYVTLWAGAAPTKKKEKLQKVIELLNSPSFIQGLDKEELEEVEGANLLS